MEQLNSDAEKNNIVFKSSENEFKYYDQLHK